MSDIRQAKPFVRSVSAVISISSQGLKKAEAAARTTIYKPGRPAQMYRLPTLVSFITSTRKTKPRLV